MAPTVGQANGPSDVPPSTLAAQLLHNAAAVDRGSARENRHGFPQLLDDVSQTEDGAQGLEDAPLVTTYHKCIHLIANEFEAATKDNPFASDRQPKKLSSLVPDPLAFLRVIVEEVPEVLVLKPEAENDGPAGYQQQPLWLWLFPKILILVGRKGFEDAQEKINAFFYAVIDVVSSSTELWNLKMVIFRYLWECCDCEYDPFSVNKVAYDVFRHFDPYGIAEPAHPLRHFQGECHFASGNSPGILTSWSR